MPSAAVAGAASRSPRLFAVPGLRVEAAALRSGGQRKLALPDGGCDPTDAWRARGAPTSPARRLVAAVLWQALRDVAAPSRGAAVSAWFASDDTAWPCSFVNCCGTLGLEPSAVRAAVARDAGAVVRRALEASRRGRI